MKINVKAALMSALILPGLGQLYKGEKIKGVILIVLVNIFILAAFFMVLKYVGPLLVSAGLNGKIDPNMVLERLHTGGAAVRYLLAAFCGLWLYSWIDAGLVKPRKQ